MEKQKTYNSQHNMKNKVRAPITLFQDLTIKLTSSSDYWLKNRQVGQCNRTVSSVIDPHKYCYLIYDKCAKAIQWRQDNPFTIWCRKNWLSICQKRKKTKMQNLLTLGLAKRFKKKSRTHKKL